MADKHNDERTDEEVMKKKKTNIRNRIALEKEEKEAEQIVQKRSLRFHTEQRTQRTSLRSTSAHLRLPA